jgi:hypothetical protein
MMGQHDRSEALFYYFRLEDQVPETHLLRLIEKHISFAFVREKLKASYSDTGCPSIDPELCCAFCSLVICTASLASASWWTSCACTWRGAGSPVWASIRRFHITPRSRKTAMDGFRNRSCSRSCLSRS